MKLDVASAAAVFLIWIGPERAFCDFADSDGWFHSGDVGELTEEGCLKVIDRIKSVPSVQPLSCCSQLRNRLAQEPSNNNLYI